MTSKTVSNEAELNTDSTDSAAPPARPARRGRAGMAAMAIALFISSLFVAGMSPADAAGRSSRNSTVVETGEIIEASKVSGNVSRRTLNRFAGATWTFNNDGTFVYAPTNARTDLFPVRGTWRRTGSGRYTLKATASVRIGYTGTASTALNCDLRTGRSSTIECYWATSMGNAAVVNNIKFAQSGLSTLYVKAKIG